MRYVWPVIWGFVVAFALGFAMRSLETSAGTSLGWPATFGPAFFGFITFFVLANLAGNRKVQNAGGAERDAALAFRPPEGKALLVVYREGFIGMAAGLNVMLDGKLVAQLKSPRFVVAPVDPGRHELTAAFGALAGAQNNAGAYVFEAKPGDVIPVRATLAMGALKNTVRLEDAGALEAVRQRLSRVTMVKAEA